MTTTMIRAALLAALCLSGMSTAEEKGPFGGFKHDSSAPIEITADSLEVRQSDQVAIFEGNVIAGQGTLRLTAARVEVYYDQEQQSGDTGAIRRLDATGDVFLSNGAETARGAEGTYNVADGMVTMTGSVLLTQGENAVSGNRLEIDLNTGVGRIVGRVGASFQPSTEN
ncbi:MAG: lipopolysaccharide transport periplasmic protein LptA [Pseudomonadota bacterium]